MISLISPLTCITIITFPLPHVQGTDVQCQQGFVPSNSKLSLCDPCIDTGVAYPGNNINRIPSYDVSSVAQCQGLCRDQDRCQYFTYDSENKWCYLKTNKNTNKFQDVRYTSGSSNVLCQSEEENEVDSNDVKNQDNGEIERRDARSSFMSGSGTPILSVYHKTGARTVLTALPATFGMQIKNETEITGQLNFTRSTLCTSSSTSVPSSSDTNNLAKRLAVVYRGDCKFAVKAENAAKEGYKGVIVLDTQISTKVDRISGVRSLMTDNIPVIFLLKNEANILENLLRENPNRTATISDAATFSWFKRPGTSTTISSTTTTTSSTTTTISSTLKFDLRNNLFSKFSNGRFFNRDYNKVFTTSSPYPPRRKADHDASVMLILEDGEDRGIIEITPLTIGAITVGVVISILLAVSIITLIVSKIRRNTRRRIQHTRCQQAIRQFDAMNAAGKDNNGYSSDGTSNKQNTAKALPKTTYNLLECPVCLEIAWPPKKIFQCREGHIVCDTCKANPNLKNCPMCRIPLSTHMASRNRSLEELARTLLEEERVSEEPMANVAIAIPTAPPPDIVSDIGDEEDINDGNVPEAAADTNQLIEDSNPDALRILSTDIIPASHLVVNLPPDTN